MGKYRDYEFNVSTPQGATIFRCKAKSEAQARAARDRYLARLSSAAPRQPLAERLSRRASPE